MSGCATRRPLEGRIPSGLLDTYVQYKKDTRAAIAWLVSHGTSRYKKMQKISIGDLFELANIVSKKAVDMPEVIDFQFREAIAARNKMSKYFRSMSYSDTDGLDTSNHEYFTNCFREIHAELCVCCVGPGLSRKQKGQARTPPGRRFALPSGSITLKAESVDTKSTDENDSCGCLCHDNSEDKQEDEQELQTTTSAKTSPRLVDDTLCEAFELQKIVQDMEDLLTATVSFWKCAAGGQIPLVVASFVTNTAFAEFEDLEQRLRISCNVLNPGMLHDRVCHFTGVASLADGVNGNDGVNRQMTESLKMSWDALLSMRDDIHARQQGANQPGLPSQLTLKQETHSTADVHECVSVLLRNIDAFIRGNCLHNGVFRVGSPVFPEVGYLMLHPAEDTNGLRCCYGLELLLTSFKGYLFGSEITRPPSSCRLQALQFAQEAIMSITAVLDDSSMPCRCPGTLACHLQNLQEDFQEFIRAKIFDFYFQAPWVSGSHILEMLGALFYYGLRLLSYRHYIGALLHAYNVLRRFTNMPSVPLFDKLSITFSDTVFPGERPSKAFKTSYIRSMGGRLRFDSHGSRHKSGCHSMAIPSHIAKATAGFGLRRDAKDARFEYRKISLFHHIKERGYHLDESLWHRVYSTSSAADNHSQSPQSVTHSSSPELNKKDRKLCFHQSISAACPHERLQTLKNAVFRDFSGPFPIARINLLEVYLACARTVSAISDRYHGPHAKPGQKCLCFVEALLEAADRCEGRGGGLFGCKELVGICQEVMVEELGERNCEEFLWRYT